MYRRMLMLAALFMILGPGGGPPVVADHCPGTTIVIGLPQEFREDPPADATMYLFEDESGNHYLYQESNGLLGLQQGGGSPVEALLREEPACAHSRPDVRYY